MVHPSDLAGEASGIVLRVGGNVLTPRGTSKVNEATITDLVRLVAESAQSGLSVTVLPGGVGGHIFLHWAQTAGCPDALTNTIGCSLMWIGATILADSLARELARLGVPCAPRPAQGYGELRDLHNSYPVAVVGGGIAGAATSDSMALLIGEALSAPVLSIKRTLPFQEIWLPADSSRDEPRVALVDITDRLLSEDFLERAGMHPPLDILSLRLLRRPDSLLWITTPEGLENFATVGSLTPVLRIANGESRS